MTMMRAVQFDRFGDAAVLVVKSVPRPVPRAGQVLIKVLAASVNGHDLQARTGFLRLATGRRFPMGTGIDFAGVIAGGSPDARLGRPVWGQLKALTRHELGTMADYVTVDEGRVASPPPGLTSAQAVSLIVPGPTAVRALTRSARLRPGERVLVRGAGGGTGLATLQLASALGAEVTTLSSRRDLEQLQLFGASRTLDRSRPELATLGSFDVIVDTVGKDLLSYRRKLAPGGRMVALAAASTSELAGVALSVAFGRRRIRTFSDNALEADLDTVSTHVQDGVFHPVVGPSFTLETIQEAHRSLEAGGVTGKRVVRVNSDSAWPDR